MADPWREKRVIGNAELYLGDCLEVLDGLRDGCQCVDESGEQGRGAGNDLKPRIFDVLITDPPYGVGFLGKTAKKRGGGQTVGVAYIGYEDTLEQHEQIVLPAIRMALSMCKRAAITPGTRRCFSYPEPTEIGCFFSAAGTGMGKWGFSCSQPILFYGADPYLEHGAGSRPNSFGQTYPNDANETGHPCAKPLPQMYWLVGRASWQGEVVMDPFMGSGTTGVACMQTGRKFIGIEIETKYFEIACERIENAQRQMRMFA